MMIVNWISGFSRKTFHRLSDLHTNKKHAINIYVISSYTVI